MALSPAATALTKNTSRIGANISKRLTRLASKDVQGGDILIERLKAELEEIRAMPVTNYREAQSKEARMRRLDKAAGTRAQSFQKAAKRAYNDDLVAQAKDPNKIIRMSKDQLVETYAIHRSRLRDRIRRVKKSINGNNFMTHIAEDLLDEYDPKTADHNKLRSLINRSSKVLSTKTLTVQGANSHIEKGVELVGEQYRTWSDKQRTAFWNAVHREMEVNALSSTAAIEVVETAMTDKKLQTVFSKDATTGELTAHISRTLNEAKAKAKRAEMDMQMGDEYFRQAFEKKGLEMPFSLSDSEKDNPFFF